MAMVNLVAPTTCVGIGNGKGFALQPFEAPAFKNAKPIKAGEVLTAAEELLKQIPRSRTLLSKGEEGVATIPDTTDAPEKLPKKPAAPKAASDKKKANSQPGASAEAVVPKSKKAREE